MQTTLLKGVTLGLSMLAAIGPAADAAAADAPSPRLALSFQPVQDGIEYETPKASEFDKCQVDVERQGKSSGWVVLGPNGQVLRRFVDTNADNIVDQWRYYQHGLETYRDIDSNFNNKVDQSRWMNIAGSRWGLDPDEDGKIDSWKVLSAEEASREAVRAVARKDAKSLEILLITRADLAELGVSRKLIERLLEAVAEPDKKLKEVWAQSKTLSSKTEWIRFDSSMPSAVPAEKNKSTSDLLVYENAMAIVESDGKHGLMLIGEMIRVGETWKLTQVPQPLEGNSVQVTTGGLLMQPTLASATSVVPGGGSVNRETQKLLEQLQKLDRDSPSPGANRTTVTNYNDRRADLMAKLVTASQSEDERIQWVRQMADSIAAAVQLETYPGGLERLKTIEEAERKANPRSETYAYVQYRRLLAEYNRKVQNAGAEEQQKIQTWWLTELERFAKVHASAEDAPEAMLQLAISHEYAGRVDDARQWYRALTNKHADSEPGQRAAGALRRFDMKGREFRLSGGDLNGGTVDTRSFRGKLLLVIYWSTHCRVCTEDLPQLRALYQQYQRHGFEILGVNLDATTEPVRQYLTRHQVAWPQLHEPGGLLSNPAISYGVILQPTMFLIDKTGKVASENITVAELKDKLPDLLSGKK